MTVEPSDPASTELDAEPTRSRRGLLKVAAVGVGAAGLAVTTGAKPAFADDPNDITMGQTKTNSGTTATSVNSTGALSKAQVLFQSGNSYTPANSNYDAALAGWASSSGTAKVGVYGYTDAAGGAALIGLAAAGGAGLRLPSLAYVSQPTSGTFEAGDFVAASDGIWQCVAGGTPGTWRKLAGPTSAGSFHAITPNRVYDSRESTRLAAGQSRDIPLNVGPAGAPAVPLGATAIAVNLTVTATVGGGYLTLYPKGVTRPTASTINWFAAGQTFANGVQVAISTDAFVTVYCGGGSTQFILDVSGYYL